MGIDFNNLINFGKSLAANDGGKNNKVIEGDARVVFGGAVNEVAKTNGVDAGEIYANNDIAGLMGATFSGNKPEVDPIVAEMMSYFSNDVDAYGNKVDMAKLDTHVTNTIAKGDVARNASNAASKVDAFEEAGVVDALAQKFTPVFDDGALSAMMQLAGLTNPKVSKDTADRMDTFAQMLDSGIPEALEKAYKDENGLA